MVNRAAAAVVAAVMLALSGCGSPAQQSTPAPSDKPPSEVSGLQIPGGRVNEAIRKLDGLVDELMRTAGIPGMAVAVVHDGKAVYAKGFGVHDRRQVLEWLRLLTLAPFRISYAYSNFGLTAAAEAVAVASGKPWEVLAEEVLSHWDGDVFTFTLQSENAQPDTISKATFAGNTVNLEYYDDDKLGTFIR